MVLKYTKFKNKTLILMKYKIKYLVLDELDIIEKYEYLDNQIDRYLCLINMKKKINEAKVVMPYKYDLL